jgi:hypothetical protein
VNGIAVASVSVSLSVTVSAIPEANTYALLLAGLGLLAFRGQRQSWRKQ